MGCSMSSKRILIKIGDKGSTVTTEGFSGKACLKEVEKLTEGLKKYGLKVDTTSITPTAEMSQTETTQQRQTA